MRNLHPTRLLPMLVLLLGATGLVRAAPELQSWQTENGAKVMFVQAGGKGLSFTVEQAPELNDAIGHGFDWQALADGVEDEIDDGDVADV